MFQSAGGVYNGPFQVAVAKHMGLVALRLTDSIIVPLNTTQYALELGDYLDEYDQFLPRAIATDQNLRIGSRS